MTTTVLLVPGAGGSAWYWHRVVPLLRDAGHRAVAVDLPAADDSAGWQEYRDACLDALAALDVTSDAAPLVVVGQSMGGFTAPLVAAAQPTAAVVLLNAMVPLPGETGGAWWEATGQGEAAAAAARAEGRDESFDPVGDFFHDVPDDVREAAFAAAEPQQSGTPFGQPWPAPRWPDVPTTVVAGDLDRLFPPAFQRRVAHERLGIAEADVVSVPAGHLAALSAPRAVADAVLDVVATSLPRRSGRAAPP